MRKSEQRLIVRLWKDWCRVWPKQYGHESLGVGADGYDPVFDLIPTQAYRDYYLEVARHHPALRYLNPFEVIDVALNQIQAPEASRLGAREDEIVEDVVDEAYEVYFERANDAVVTVEEHESLPQPTVVEVELVPDSASNRVRRRNDSV